MSRKARSLVVAFVLFTFAGSAAQALPWTVRPAAPEGVAILASAWEWVASLFAPAIPSESRAPRKRAAGALDPGAFVEGGAFGGGGGDAGMIMDPNGFK